MTHSHDFTDDDLAAIEESLMLTLMGDDTTDATRPAMELSLSKVRRKLGWPIAHAKSKKNPYGVEAVRAWVADARALWEEEASLPA